MGGGLRRYVSIFSNSADYLFRNSAFRFELLLTTISVIGSSDEKNRI